MTHLGNIRESDIQTAVSMADLDAPCAYQKDIADIEDGGIAALAFSLSTSIGRQPIVENAKAQSAHG